MQSFVYFFFVHRLLLVWPCHLSYFFIFLSDMINICVCVVVCVCKVVGGGTVNLIFQIPRLDTMLKTNLVDMENCWQKLTNIFKYILCLHQISSTSSWLLKHTKLSALDASMNICECSNRYISLSLSPLQHYLLSIRGEKMVSFCCLPLILMQQ